MINYNYLIINTVLRSPGGTPIREKPRPASAQDPAALIAQALKKKFAHRVYESPDQDKENARFSPSPTKSPFDVKLTPVITVMFPSIFEYIQ